VPLGARFVTCQESLSGFQDHANPSVNVGFAMVARPCGAQARFGVVAVLRSPIAPEVSQQR
jgi:hypothetical protein